MAVPLLNNCLDKIYSFWGHLQIASINGSNLNDDPEIAKRILAIPNVQSASAYLNQTMVLAKEIEIEGLNAKGIADYNHIPNLFKGRVMQSNGKTLSRSAQSPAVS